MLTRHRFHPEGKQSFHRQTGWSFWLLSKHSWTFSLPPHIWHFLIRRFALNAGETRTRVCGTPTSLWCLCCSGWSLCWTSLEREQLAGAPRSEVRLSLSMLRQSLSILKQLGSAAKWVLLDPRSRYLQNEIYKSYIMLFRCDVWHPSRTWRWDSCLWLKGVLWRERFQGLSAPLPAWGNVTLNCFF